MIKFAVSGPALLHWSW